MTNRYRAALANGWRICKDTLAAFNNDGAMRFSAALAYYSIFSIAPLVLVAVGIAGWVFGEETVRKEVERQLSGVLGDRTTHAVQTLMEAWQKRGSGVATAFGLAALILGASGVFAQLQDALNIIWKTKPKPGRGLWRFLRHRFLSMTMVLGTGFLLLVSMILTTLLNAFSSRVENMMPALQAIAWILNLVLSIGVVTLLFAMIFKFLPDVKMKWRHVWVGAIGTALLFTAGKELLGLYLGRESTASAYGAAGSIVLVVLWVYYASLIVFLGAEFTKVFTKAAEGSKPPADPDASYVKRDETTQQPVDESHESHESHDGRAPHEDHEHEHAH